MPAARPAGKTIAIHQPNFLPWLGFFHKIANSDVFVLLDHVQFPKTGGSWTNRVKVMVGDAGAWLTVPVRRDYHGVRRVNEMEIDDSRPWRETMRKTLETNYRRSPYFSQTMDLVGHVFSYSGHSLAAFNALGIRKTLDYLGWVDREPILSSSLARQEHGTELLVAISRDLGGQAYLCGGGAEGYQDDQAFRSQGLDLVYQNFSHPVYRQSRRPDFLAGLSIVDALFEIGPQATATLLEAHIS